MGLKPRSTHASKLLSELRFWRIIEDSLGNTASVGLSRNRQDELLVKALEKLSRTELVGYDYHLGRFFDLAYKQQLWAVAYIVMGGCGNDCFMDFRVWLVLRGENVYRAALRDHESLCDEFDKIPRGDIPLTEDATHFARQVFEAEHGEGSFEAEEQRYDRDQSTAIARLDFEWSSSDEASLERLCPKTYARWWGNLRF